MLTEHIRPEVKISEGKGIVALQEGWMAFARGDEDRLVELKARFESLSQSSFKEAVRSITDSIIETGFEKHPSVTCLRVEDGKISAFVFRAVELTLVLSGEIHVLDGRDSNTWIDVILHGSIDQIRVRATEGAPVIDVLRAGIVPASGFLFQSPEYQATLEAASSDDHASAAVRGWQRASADSATGAEATVNGMFALLSQLDPANNLEPRSTDLVERLDALRNKTSTDEPSLFEKLGREIAEKKTAPVTLAKSRPVLSGVHCPSGHFTPAEDPNCRSCGAALNAAAPSVTAPRPILGYLTFDDGAVLPLDRPAAIGADVPHGYSVDNEPTTLVRLDDGHGGLSDVQLEVRPTGWNVEVVDMDSKNGTFSIPSKGSQSRIRLPNGMPVTLKDGVIIEAGTRTFTFTFAPAS